MNINELENLLQPNQFLYKEAEVIVPATTEVIVPATTRNNLPFIEEILDLYQGFEHRIDLGSCISTAANIMSRYEVAIHKLLSATQIVVKKYNYLAVLFFYHTTCVQRRDSHVSASLEHNDLVFAITVYKELGANTFHSNRVSYTHRVNHNRTDVFCTEFRYCASRNSLFYNYRTL